MGTNLVMPVLLWRAGEVWGRKSGLEASEAGVWSCGDSLGAPLLCVGGRPRGLLEWPSKRLT